MDRMTDTAAKPVARMSLTGYCSWLVVDADPLGRTSAWLLSGWYRRENINGTYKFTPITGWRLIAHRLLWGFQGLVDAR